MLSDLNHLPLVLLITRVDDLCRMIGGLLELDGIGVTNQLITKSHLTVGISRGYSIDASKYYNTNDVTTEI